MQECIIMPDCKEKFRRIESHQSENYTEIKLIQKDLEYIKLSLDSMREISKEYSEDKKEVFGRVISEIIKWLIPLVALIAAKSI